MARARRRRGGPRNGSRQVNLNGPVARWDSEAAMTRLDRHGAPVTAWAEIHSTGTGRYLHRQVFISGTGRYLFPPEEEGNTGPGNRDIMIVNRRMHRREASVSAATECMNLKLAPGRARPVARRGRH